MRPTALGWKALVFHALLTLAFYVSPYTNLFFLLLTFFVTLLLSSAVWARHNIVRTRAPGILELAQPKLVGAVERVDAAGKLVTVLITDDPADAGCKAGYSFAIYSGSTYKGEAVVTSVDGKFAFCRVTRSTGRDILPGDQATTVTN